MYLYNTFCIYIYSYAYLIDLYIAQVSFPFEHVRSYPMKYVNFTMKNIKCIRTKFTYLFGKFLNNISVFSQLL